MSKEELEHLRSLNRELEHDLRRLHELAVLLPYPVCRISAFYRIMSACTYPL